ncbi:MAG: RNA methyltransferase [Polyangiaceae bacterium]|nr:RNA methyltransferase [Polyangiaceae bacterium]
MFLYHAHNARVTDDDSSPSAAGDTFRFFATAAKGTEGAIRDELREHRFFGVRADRGGVHFQGRLTEGFRACIELRCAVRVLVLIAEFHAPNGEALYEGVYTVDWAHVLDADRTLAVRAFAKNSALSHTQFIAQKTKDAVVDQLRDRLGSRPNVDRDDPDVLLFVHIADDHARVYLDMSGESLHTRGYRRLQGDAPLKESLAASLLRLSEWDRKRPLIDPMCGSGTLAIEAFLWSHDIAPGLRRERFGFERWRSHGDAEARAVSDLRERARSRIIEKGPLVWAFDASRTMVAVARENARAADIHMRIEERTIDSLSPLPTPGVVIVNPPYGERLPADQSLYETMASAFRRMKEHRIAVLAGAPEVEAAVPRRPTKVYTVFNGPIECRFFLVDIP